MISLGHIFHLKTHIFRTYTLNGNSNHAPSITLRCSALHCPVDYCALLYVLAPTTQFEECGMTLSDEGKLSVIAVILVVVSMLWTFYTEASRRQERKEDKVRIKANFQQDVAWDYEAIDGSASLEALYEFRHTDRPKYWEDIIMRPSDDKLRKAQRKLNGFWDRTINAYMDGNLPDDFFARGKTWLQSGHNYRMIVEPIDIADYYNNPGWDRRGHYLESNNRHFRFKFLDDMWKKAYNSQDSVQLAKDLQRQTEPHSRST